MTNLNELEPIFRKVFDDDSILLQRETSSDDIEEWDSLTHMNLVVALELSFKIKFALGELQKLRNVGEMLDLINRKLGK
ncbi:MAG: acyl carrier protein [Deltaproteobacteria bacterium]|nr:acyl carrier protein [Deltaproteobacteria bacterium]